MPESLACRSAFKIRQRVRVDVPALLRTDPISDIKLPSLFRNRTTTTGLRLALTLSPKQHRSLLNCHLRCETYILGTSSGHSTFLPLLQRVTWRILLYCSNQSCRKKSPLSLQFSRACPSNGLRRYVLFILMTLGTSHAQLLFKTRLRPLANTHVTETPFQ